MTISKQPDGRYLVDLRPQGREGKRIRKRFPTKSEAQQFERWAIGHYHDKDWQERPADTRVAHCRVTFVDTKNGKDRTVPISETLEAKLKARGRGALFPLVNYDLVRDALKKVAPELPKGQAVHALRHTFASHFIMSGGNILVLQKILGHAKIQQTMVYAHLAPDFLQDAVKFNPLEN